MRGKEFSRPHFEIFFLFFLENKIGHLMHIVLGDNLHEVLDAIFLEKNKKNMVSLLSANLPIAW